MVSSCTTSEHTGIQAMQNTQETKEQELKNHENGAGTTKRGHFKQHVGTVGSGELQRVERRHQKALTPPLTPGLS